MHLRLQHNSSYDSGQNEAKVENDNDQSQHFELHLNIAA